MNNLTIALEIKDKYLPKSADFIAFGDARLKNGRYALRCTLDKLLTPFEVEKLSKCRNVIEADCVTHHRYAPEIRYSYFYVTA